MSNIDPLNFEHLNPTYCSNDPLYMCDTIDETKQLPDFITNDFIDRKYQIYHRIQSSKNKPVPDGQKRVRTIRNRLREKLRRRQSL